ncbi:MAG: CoA-transferase, partial [Acidimicrobiales bacterium]
GTDERYVACTPLAVDVAIVHGHTADASGNVRVDPKLVWMDNEIVNAAAATICSVERIVDHRAFVAEPERTTYPRFMVDAVVEVPWGAYPTSCFPAYCHDTAFFDDYGASVRDPLEWKRFWEDRIVGPVSQGAFIDANGGARVLVELARGTR